MIDEKPEVATREIIVDEVFPHSAETLWHALTSGELMARWLMKPAGFEAVVGTPFTFQTTPAGEWDGTIECRVLEVEPGSRLAWSWKGGHDGNVGYGSRLDTVVTFTLTPEPAGTRLRLVHSGFVLPRNETAFEKMSAGWRSVVQTIGQVAAETH